MIARRGLTQGETIELKALPKHAGDAFVAIEDRRFRHHFGIDPVGLARAAYADIKARSFVQGGSTLTQQLAKNLFLKPERTLKRKLEEAMLAVYLEARYSKDDRPGPTEIATPGYTILDAGLGSKIGKHLEARVSGRNLTDAEYYASPDARFVLAPGRSASLSLTARF